MYNNDNLVSFKKWLFRTELHEHLLLNAMQQVLIDICGYEH